jgi:membrane peptidoglycan carboxypeptidase
MEALLVKVFATALALSQVMTTPGAVRTEFDREHEQPQVAEILNAGCAHMLKAFELEDINIDDLIATAMDDPQAIEGAKALRGIDFADLRRGYKQFCKNEKVDRPPVDLGAVIDFYNEAAANLPDHTKLKEHKLPGSSAVLDHKGRPFAEVFEQNQHRVWIKLEDIPEHVREAFIAAEDKRFYQHHGVDEHGLIRAFIGNLAHSGRPQGGSTITQQVVKNLLVGEDVSYERKIREMIVAARLETTLTKDEILQLYLNCVYLGRGAWGVEVAARSYFGKPAKDLTLNEGALLAGLTKGPTYFSPDRAPNLTRERLAYVLNRMREDGMSGWVSHAEAPGSGSPSLPVIVASARSRRDIGFHFLDQVAREAKTLAGLDGMTDTSYTVHSTIDQPLQRAVEEALQEGLARYERDSGRAQFMRPEANLGAAILRLEADRSNTDRRPFWQQALAGTHLPLYDVHWMPAAVVGRPTGKRGDSWRVGLLDGRILPLTLPPINAGRSRDYWSPKNYDGSEGGVLTLRQALENSRNLATAHLLQGGIEDKPEASLGRLCELALEAQIYRECLHYYPFVLGAEAVRPVDLAAFFATIANEGMRPAPHVIDSVERDGTVVYRQNSASATRISSIDQAAFYQLKSMMQGVLARGTAHSIADLAPYVAGKTGTSDDENDAWFVGFTNEVTVAVWVGYDNADGKRRTLGGGATGGGVAVPIFEPVIRAVWNEVAPRTALAPPSPEAKRDLMCTSVDADSAEVKRRGTTNISECLRIDVKGRVIDTRMALLEPGASRGSKNRQDDEESPRKKMALRERHHRYASERLPQARQIAPQGGFFGGGGFGGGGWFGSAGQYGGGSWGR